MAVFEIGAYYDEDVSSDFINKECACIGYDKLMLVLYMKC